MQNGSKNLSFSFLSICFYSKCTAHPPEIKLQPKEHTTTVGGKEILSVQAGGTKPLQYSWEYKPLQELAEGEGSEWKALPMDSDRIQGANSGNLVITEVNKSDEGRYRCIVSNKVGSMQTSEATLTMGKLTCMGVVTS